MTVDTVVRALMVDMHKNSGETDVAKMRKQEAELVALCKKKIAEANGDDSPVMHREAFESNYKNIFGAAASQKIERSQASFYTYHSCDRGSVPRLTKATPEPATGLQRPGL